jgi:hypothetical protein
MKFPIAIILLSLLVALFYKTPTFLLNLVDNSLGKIALLVLIVVVMKKVGTTEGLLLSLIFVLLLHNSREGFSIKFDSGNVVEGLPESNQKKEDEDNEEDNEEEEDEEEEIETDKKKEGLCTDCAVKNSKKYRKKEGFVNRKRQRLGLHKLEDVNAVEKGISFRNITDVDRKLKLSAEQAKVSSTME